MMYEQKGLETLVGKKIEKVFFSKQGLKFQTDQGAFAFEVGGDCCSGSEFWDFFGVKNLLVGGPVISAESVELDPADGRPHPSEKDYDVIQYYGYKLVTEHPDFGDVTSVFSFRNTSNGYYGGYMRDASPASVNPPEITDDVLEAAD